MAAGESADPGSYVPPPPPPTPSLVGSSVDVSCVGDVPTIVYHLVVTDPGALTGNHVAALVISDGVNRVDVTLGDVSSGSLDGTVLWPGASADASGKANGWPGWVFRDGAWAETAGNYAWTRGAITVTLRVNPELRVALTYPPATSACASPKVARTLVSAAYRTLVSGQSKSLPATGGQVGAVVAISAAGVGAVALGGVVLVARRRRV